MTNTWLPCHLPFECRKPLLIFHLSFSLTGNKTTEKIHLPVKLEQGTRNKHSLLQFINHGTKNFPIEVFHFLYPKYMFNIGEMESNIHTTSFYTCCLLRRGGGVGSIYKTENFNLNLPKRQMAIGCQLCLFSFIVLPHSGKCYIIFCPQVSKLNVVVFH